MRLDLNDIFVIASVSTVAITGYFFYLGRGLPIFRRILASIHSVCTLASLYILGWAMRFDVALSTQAGAALVIGFSAVSIASMIYSVRVLEVWQTIHLLHLVSLAILWGNFAIGMMLVYGT